MVKRVPFSAEEFSITGAYKIYPIIRALFEGMSMPVPPGEPKLNRPISPKENMKMLLRGEIPYWIPVGFVSFGDVQMFSPRQVPDNYATRVIMDGGEVPDYPSTTLPGWFDLMWQYVPEVGGATVLPGNPRITDMSDWESELTMPDLDAIDWEEMKEMNREYLSTDKFNTLNVNSSSWERLLSLMDVENAAMAIIDEDQLEGIHRFLDKYTDVLSEYVRRVKACCDIDNVVFHDDWGHQRSAFFSPAVAKEVFLPHLKKLVDCCHSLGLTYEQHSCGKNEPFIDLYIEAGVDLYSPQGINDFEEILAKAHGSRLVIGLPDPIIDPAASEDTIRQQAIDWFDKYKDERVVTCFYTPNSVFMNTIYECSRNYYNELAEKADRSLAAQ